MRKWLYILATLLLFTQPAFPADGGVGIRTFAVVRSAAVLTTSYVSTDSVNMANNNQLVCFLAASLGSLTTIETKVQYSNDNTTWFDDAVFDTGSGGVTGDEYIAPLRVNVYQLQASGSKTLYTPAMARYARLMVKGTGTVTGSSLAVSCFAGIN